MISCIDENTKMKEHTQKHTNTRVLADTYICNCTKSIHSDKIHHAERNGNRQIYVNS
jgi:hypothetical protein